MKWTIVGVTVFAAIAAPVAFPAPVPSLQGSGDVLEPQSLERQVSHTAFGTRQTPAFKFALDLHIHANSDGRYVLDPLLSLFFLWVLERRFAGME